MKRTIRNRGDLQREITRLKEEKLVRERVMNDKIHSITEQLKPANLIRNAFRGFTGDSELKNAMASRGTEAVFGFVVSNLLFKNANPLIRTVASMLGTTAAMKFFGEDSGKYIEQIKNLFRKLKEAAGRQRKEDSMFDEEDIYKG
jgi:predicted lipase